MNTKLGVFCTLAAWAATEARAGEPIGAQTLVWSRAFTLAVPERDPMAMPGPDRATFTEGLLVELRADPALLVPRQVGEPVLYVGDRPAMRLNWDHVGGCVVAVVVGPVDLATEPVFFGGDTGPSSLPERVTPAVGAEARTEALAAGIAPFAATEIAAAARSGGGPIAAHDLRDVHAAGMARVAACTSTPADRARAGVTAR